MTAIWTTGTQRTDDPGETIIMLPGDTMAPGDSFTSVNERFVLIFQEDGNLVLTDDGVPAWASATEGMSATSVVMQTDGNLVVYDDSIPAALWASDTNGNPNSVLVLRENGNLAIYNFGGFETLGVMSILPDWAEVNPETLEWAVSVTESPLSVEQRMGLRFSPRKLMEYGYTLFGTKRTYFDLLMTAAGGSPMYVPVFYENHTIDEAVVAGDTTILVDTRWSELRDYDKAVLISGLFDHEIVEIWSVDDSSLTLVNPLQSDWPKGARIYPVMRAKVETPMASQRYADRALKGRMRFQSMEPNISSAEATFGEFLGHPVLEREPNDIEPLQYQYDRRTFNIDNNTGLQKISDVAPFSTISYAWFVQGKEALWALRGIFYALEGRRVPLWIPSFFADFDLVEPAAADDTTLIVKRCGYTDTGGPFKNREFILVHLHNGTRLYFNITASAIVGEGTTEELALNQTLGTAITPDTVLRISFLFFCRLDQDSVELAHHTDTHGLTTSTSVFRLDPGIAGIDNYDDVGVDSSTPGIRPVFDPFRPPDSKLWLYAPSFGGGSGDLVNFWWNGRRPDEDIHFSGYAFPSGNVAPTGQNVILPDTGSVLIRLKATFNFTFGVPTSIDVWFHYNNSTLDDVKVTILGPAFALGFYAEMQSDRNDIITSKIDPDLPITVQCFFRGSGDGGNVFPAANVPDNDAEPYHEGSDGSIGDSAWIIEWWA